MTIAADRGLVRWGGVMPRAQLAPFQPDREEPLHAEDGERQRAGQPSELQLGERNGSAGTDRHRHYGRQEASQYERDDGQERRVVHPIGSPDRPRDRL